jgi:hypothetical protein
MRIDRVRENNGRSPINWASNVGAPPSSRGDSIQVSFAAWPNLLQSVTFSTTSTLSETICPSRTQPSSAGCNFRDARASFIAAKSAHRLGLSVARGCSHLLWLVGMVIVGRTGEFARRERPRRGSALDDLWSTHACSRSCGNPAPLCWRRCMGLRFVLSARSMTESRPLHKRPFMR